MTAPASPAKVRGETILSVDRSPTCRRWSMTRERVEALRAGLPELPWVRRERLIAAHGLAADTARLLTSARELADYFEAAVRAAAAPGAPTVDPQALAHWILGDGLRELKSRRLEPGDLAAALPPARLAALVALVDSGRLSVSAGREIFAAIFQSGEEPAAAVERLGLAQVTDDAVIGRWVEAAIAAYPAQAAELRAGKIALLGFLTGQVMRLSGGRADPARVQRALREAVALLSVAAAPAVPAE